MVKVIVGLMGSAPHIQSTSLSTAGGVSDFLSICARHHVRELDTAAAYVRSEVLLGEVGACSRFSVSTKAPAFSPKSLTYDNIITRCNRSLAELKTEKVDIYYLHGPDHATPLEEQCDAIGALHAQGKFERFGVSNIRPAAVRTIYDYCKRKGYCLPKVYQGAYNPIQRPPETEIFPLLRELGMVYYAYSPLAGGLFAKPLEQIMSPEAEDRYKVFPVFQRYLTDESVQGLRTLHEKCKEEEVGLLEATIRWFRHHSALGEEDGFILGASKIEQLDGTLGAAEKGPLPQSLVDAYETLWEQTKGKAAAWYF
ncbi:2,3-bisphosphoglycerate-independent phosphoglycerate mutase [Elsinoe australis]|uniref:2,3-bisphosphoglycerate-independent phosphoglycerate mutase n=1 Tax=Elsinoe australis TaxID=40998 RepID=A0A2P7YVX2_9PEZI|nr:2,3-bisphosphoglycerate-independent phosphoglycerate mutase [Elsinoe australis]